MRAAPLQASPRRTPLSVLVAPGARLIMPGSLGHMQRRSAGRCMSCASWPFQQLATQRRLGWASSPICSLSAGSAWAPRRACAAYQPGSDWHDGPQSVQACSLCPSASWPPACAPAGGGASLDPILAYNAGAQINQLQWSSAQPDWLAICFGNKAQILRV